MIARLLLRAAAFAFLGLLALRFAVALSGCGHREGQRAEQAAQPSQHVSTRTERDGTETATYTVMLATQADAIERLRADSSRLAHRLADELIRVPHVRAATAFATATPCGDTIEQIVTLREERAPGALGFLKPRETRLDLRQLTPGAHTLAGLQSFALPTPKPRRFGLGAFVGVGVGPDLHPVPLVGVGLSYNLFSF